MKLPGASFLKKQTAQAHYLALLLGDEKVTAVIFAEENNKIHAVSSHTVHFPTDIESAEIEEWLDVFDKAVSISETKLPEGTPQVEKTIFGVKETWIENEKIKKEYLSKLKKVCDELSLSPIGFLVFSEATAHLLEKQEGAPVSAVYVQIGKQILTVSILKGSKVVETRSTKSETYKAPQLVDSLLRHFSSFEVLPQKVIVQNDTAKTEKENHELQQEFLHHKWSTHLPFLHLPKIIMLPLEFEQNAILFGAATQMGVEVADNIIQTHAITAEPPQATEEIQSNKPEHSPDSPEFTDIEGENFGFVQGTDIAFSRKKEPEKEITPLSNEQVPTQKDDDEFLESVEEQEIAKNESMGLPVQGFLLGSAIRKFFTKIPLKLPQFAVGSALKGGKLIFIAPVVLLLLAAFAAFYFLAIKTTVSLAIAPDTKAVDENVTFTPTGDSDFSNNVLSAQTVTVDESGSTTVSATGKKNVGDKAKGTVTLHNKETNKAQIAAGTTITSSNGLKYTLDKDVSIASASASDSGITFGSADVSVTASDIGTNYNLPSGTQFSVNDSVTAKNGSAFSGGTQKTVTVVAQADLNKAVSQLQNSIADKAKTDVSGKLSGGQTLLSDFSASTMSKKNFDHKVGDQANNITLNGSVTYKALAYQKDDLTKYGEQVLKNKGNDKQKLDSSSISAEIHSSKTASDGTVKASLSIKGNFLPILDTNEIAKKIAGKSFTDAQSILKTFPQVADSTITLTPNIPVLPKRISFKSSNITVVTHNE